MVNYDMLAAELVNLTERPPAEFDGAICLVEAAFGAPPSPDQFGYLSNECVSWQDVVLDTLHIVNDNSAEATARIADVLRAAA